MIGALLLAVPLVARAAGGLPAEVDTALRQAKVPADALVAVVQEVGAPTPRLAWQPTQAVNPASLTKLMTTYAALDLLGPAWTWTTPVWLQGTVKDGALDGDLVIKGTGDAKLVLERLWLLMRRVRQAGVQEIRGDIVLDRTAFVVPEQSPADFDGEPLRPYNVRPDALLLNYKAVLYTFMPNIPQRVAHVVVEPPMAGVRVDATVPLTSGPCDDWRAALKADFADATRVRFAGSYPVACGEKAWAQAYADPKTYNARTLEGLWNEMGGKLDGDVRDGTAPSGTEPTFASPSPALAETIRDINKYSNNVMAQQLFLTLGLTQRGVGTPETARDVLKQWLGEKLGEAAAREIVIDNGSGLSRDTRVNAGALAKLLLQAWQSPVMPELVSSLPISGLDGTLRRSRAPQGKAHLKTGSLRDVAGIAGYVLGANGRRWVLVAIVNHANANAARPALDALVQWTAAQDGRRQEP